MYKRHLQGIYKLHTGVLAGIYGETHKVLIKVHSTCWYIKDSYYRHLQGTYRGTCRYLPSHTQGT